MPADRRVLVLAGRGRYEDPWHDHAATSAGVARVLGDLEGTDVEVRSTFPDALDDLDALDLLVVNSGRGRPDPAFDGDDVAWARLHRRLSAHVRGGGAVLALHQAASTFPDSPTWADDLGGRWVPGESWHPPLGAMSARPVEGSHPLVDGLGAVEAVDERYCGLRVTGDVVVTLTVEDDEGGVHPAGWVHAAGGRRVVYDGLGHDVRALASPGRRDLLRREARWLLEG
ncbi:ThuA domain-containing protein [Pseudokineococcus basanitobsidens]|uniref:ThuA domain-containing protein n=1 Tax=Pseudokineococcus basanitobsidens TaxID=1926649 RepID=A0ABU8RLN1_9ACTN